MNPTNTIEQIRTKVIAKLIKNGNNPDDVKKMVELHFDFAYNNYGPTVAKIAECIRYIY